jgi:ATP-dependent exoDNAse (exonuclease V) beta subunit
MSIQSAPFIIYKSSAGSGKTYTLTLEYLKLALMYPDAFRSILAVTFTNKATQEMKERILKELNRLSKSVQPGGYMDETLMASLKVDADGLQYKARVTQTMILHDYGRFSVSTIDSFFQKVVRAFAREVDLNAKFEVELDQSNVLDKVVERVIDKVTEDELLHRWLVNYAIEEIEKGKSWDIRGKIKALGQELFQESFKKYAPEIRVFLKEDASIRQLLKIIRSQKAELIKITGSLKEEANKIRLANGLEWSDFKGGKNSFANKFDQLGDKENPVPEPNKSLLNAIGNEEGWSTKTSQQKDAISNAYHQGLGDILSQFPELEYQWKTLEAITRNIYVFGIFRNLLEELTLLKEEENILLISDANEFLKEITKENEAPFIYEKVGNQYKNYLIDEFQDTSGFQWSSFKPLLENSLSQGQTNLLVGDVKQSIYRWRGGEMRLLLEEVEQQLGKNYIDNRNLDTNFRSLPSVVNFNNTLFQTLPSSLSSGLMAKGSSPEKVCILEKAYKDVSQKISAQKARSTYQGMIRLEMLKEGEGEEKSKFADQSLEILPDTIMQLQDHGYQPRDIAFLVRTKYEGEKIADTLMAYAQDHPGSDYAFDVLSDESMFLYKSSAVKALLAGLRYLHSPSDVVQFRTMWYYYAVLKGEVTDHGLFALSDLSTELKEKIDAFLEAEHYLLKLPLIEILEELIGLLELQEHGLELAYLSGFREAIYDFTSKNRADLAGFLEWWENNQEKRTVKIPESHNAMRILTIHKSKGLQFKVVLMPFLDWTIFDTRKSNVVWAPFKDQKSGLEAIVPLSLYKGLSQSAFRDIYEEEEILAYLDTLNLVYVAFTRAEEIFWASFPFKEKTTDSSSNQVAYHLQQIVSQLEAEALELDLSVSQHENRSIYQWGSLPEVVSGELKPTSSPALNWAYQNWSQLLKVRKYPVDFSQEGLEQRRKREFGLLIHELLENAKNKAEVFQILEGYYFEGRVNSEEFGSVHQQLERLFLDPFFASWFESEGVLLKEQGILLPGGESKRPDRIIIEEEQAIIVDFKTGEAYGSHQKQVKEYMKLVGQLTSLPTKGFLCYLEKNEVKEVVL